MEASLPKQAPYDMVHISGQHDFIQLHSLLRYSTVLHGSFLTLRTLGCL